MAGRVQRIDRTDEWDEFVESINGDTLAQTAAWGLTKNPDRAPFVLGIREGTEIVAGCHVIRRTVGPVRVDYAPRGPLVAPGHEHRSKELVDSLVRELTSFRPGVLILQPTSEHPELSAALSSAGFGPAPLDVTTPATVEIPLDADVESLFAGLRSSRRRNVRKAEKAGLTVRLGSYGDLTTFHDLYRNTARRQGFTPLPIESLERQWSVLGKTGRLNIFLAELHGEAMSAATVSTFGNRSVFKLAGLSEDPRAREVRASDYLHWRIMVETKELGCRFYDLGGFDKEAAKIIADGGEPPDHIRNSASQFKLGFGGDVRVLPEAQWRLSPGPLRSAQGAAAMTLARSDRLMAALNRLRD